MVEFSKETEQYNATQSKLFWRQKYTFQKCLNILDSQYNAKQAAVWVLQSRTCEAIIIFVFFTIYIWT